MKISLLLKHSKLGFLAFMFTFSSFLAQAQKEKLQTAFIFQLTRLIEWCPVGKQGNFVIGVLGDSPALMAELGALNGRKVVGQGIEVKVFSSVAEITSCNMLFIPNNRSGDLKAVVGKIGNNCTLIISDKAGAANQGAGISFVFLDDQSKIQYEINRNYMSKYSLNVNEQLFKLAREVY